VEARLTDGSEVYPHRPELYELPFWKCDQCSNFVGCHHKSNDPKRPLGVIPSEELRRYRKYLHTLIDPLWQNGLIKRKALYRQMSDRLGWRYHTATLRNIDDAKRAYSVAKSIKEELIQVRQTLPCPPHVA
jgi:hypothetical protein